MILKETGKEFILGLGKEQAGDPKKSELNLDQGLSVIELDQAAVVAQREIASFIEDIDRIKSEFDQLVENGEMSESVLKNYQKGLSEIAKRLDELLYQHSKALQDLRSDVLEMAKKKLSDHKRNIFLFNKMEEERKIVRAEHEDDETDMEYTDQDVIEDINFEYREIKRYGISEIRKILEETFNKYKEDYLFNLQIVKYHNSEIDDLNVKMQQKSKEINDLKGMLTKYIAIIRTKIEDPTSPGNRLTKEQCLAKIEKLQSELDDLNRKLRYSERLRGERLPFLKRDIRNIESAKAGNNLSIQKDIERECQGRDSELKQLRRRYESILEEEFAGRVRFEMAVNDQEMSFFDKQNLGNSREMYEKLCQEILGDVVINHTVLEDRE